MQHTVYYNHKLRDDFLDHAWSFSFVGFCLFVLPVPSSHDLEKVTFDDIGDDRASFSSEL